MGDGQQNTYDIRVGGGILKVERFKVRQGEKVEERVNQKLKIYKKPMDTY